MTTFNDICMKYMSFSMNRKTFFDQIERLRNGKLSLTLYSDIKGNDVVIGEFLINMTGIELAQFINLINKVHQRLQRKMLDDIQNGYLNLISELQREMIND